MTNPAAHTCPPAVAINNLIPMAHVADVGRSVAFYAKLGFTLHSSHKDHTGRTFWARMESGRGEIMLTQASGPVDASVQAVLFYMYSEDIAGLRQHLLADGLRDGGRFTGEPGPNAVEHESGREVVFDITHPFYMAAGEIRVSDPDGYCVLVGQLA